VLLQTWREWRREVTREVAEAETVAGMESCPMFGGVALRDLEREDQNPLAPLFPWLLRGSRHCPDTSEHYPLKSLSYLRLPGYPIREQYPSIPAGRSVTSYVETLAAETSGLTRPLILERGSIVFRRASGNGDRLRTIAFHKGLCLWQWRGLACACQRCQGRAPDYVADQRCQLSFKNFRGRRSARLPVCA
jgi:hypothetical protein